MKDVVIFDLDGTLALIDHRRHLVDGPVKNWPAFFAACVDDRPNIPVITALLALEQRGYEIWIWSGRSDEVQDATIRWLLANDCQPNKLRMRPAGDHQPDEKLKASWLAQVNKDRILCVFEDRDRMVKMWRDAGLACFQVAPGDF